MRWLAAPGTKRTRHERGRMSAFEVKADFDQGRSPVGLMRYPLPFLTDRTGVTTGIVGVGRPGVSCGHEPHVLPRDAAARSLAAAVTIYFPLSSGRPRAAR